MKRAIVISTVILLSFFSLYYSSDKQMFVQDGEQISIKTHDGSGVSTVSDYGFFEEDGGVFFGDRAAGDVAVLATNKPIVFEDTTTTTGTVSFCEDGGDLEITDSSTPDFTTFVRAGDSIFNSTDDTVEDAIVVASVTSSLITLESAYEGTTGANKNFTVAIISRDLGSPAPWHIEYGNKDIILNRNEGMALTLPEATGSGFNMDFFIPVALASYPTTYTVTITCDSEADTMSGYALYGTGGATTQYMFEADPDNDDMFTISGVVTPTGIRITFKDLLPSRWYVEAKGGFGTIDPFSDESL